MSLLGKINHIVKSLALDRSDHQTIEQIDSSIAARYILSIHTQFKYSVTQIGADL